MTVENHQECHDPPFLQYSQGMTISDTLFTIYSQTRLHPSIASLDLPGAVSIVAG